MFTKHTMIHDAFQMNLFVTLNLCQSLSNFSYLVSEFSSRDQDEDLLDDEEEEKPAVRHQDEPRRLLA